MSKPREATYRVQVWAPCGHKIESTETVLGVWLYSVPVFRWIDLYAGPDRVEAEICRDVYAEQADHVRLLKLEKA